MQYKVLPGNFRAETDPFRLLPPEMVSTIFRYLDTDSLLSVHRTCERFRAVCLHDPQLRSRLRSKVTKLRMERQNRIMDPSFDIDIVRRSSDTPTGITTNFTSSVKKFVIESYKKEMYAKTIPNIRSFSFRSEKKTKTHRSMRI